MAKDWRQEKGNRRQDNTTSCFASCLFMLSLTIISHQSFKLIFPTIFLQRQLGNPSRLFSKRTLSNIKKTEIKHFPILLFVITEIIYTFAIQGLHFKAYRK